MGAENSNQTDKPRFVGSQVKLEKLCSKGKSSLRQKDLLNDGPYPVYGASGVIGTMSTYQNDAPYVCVVKDGAGVGRAMKCRAHSSVLGTMQALVPSEGINCDYLLHLVRSLKLGEGFTGSTIPHIYFRDYGKRLVPVFPYEQQIAIASMLNGIEALVDQRKLMLRKYDSLVKSRFIEMFGELRENSQFKLQDTCSLITDGTHQPPKFAREGIPFLFVSNITSNEIAYETDRFIDEPTYKQLIKRTPIEVGDLLVSAVGSFGHPAVIRSDRPFCFQRHIAYLKPKHDMIDSIYLHSYLLTDDAQKYMDKAATGVAQRTVSLKSFKTMPVPLPALTEQRSFASFVSRVDKLRFAIQEQIEKLETLKASLMQEYFG